MFSPSIKNTIDRWIEVFLILLMALMVINVSWQVGSRYILNDPSSFTDELARYMLIWVGMLGAAYVAGKDEHLAIDIVLTKMNPTNRIKTQMLIHVFVMLFALAAMVIGGVNLVYITFILGQNSAALQIPLAYVYVVIPFSGLLVIYYQISRIVMLNQELKNS
ncbi:TRAP transporter small permease [Algoriphagus zhangzhouensis]|uniref:TRAP-type C4-dicarboxylate transport system, small permease component n=1 Tax=Algoriphagus zhangzhouensis TaxID=1073327 RepID=A0A1M7ZJ48_9BACT|nr:TRAP transporter small permease [Algoriphagus zhangzhouensis]TDY43671.1 TRAP-type C4-dicarboxylate transport system permease small subunit [Algoriphagus zhangzhouensis]SHO64842.1 TRAP-type C4-dicarboxylate transport system, small permease component [Algoriphagus zhangzhouensis]